MTDTVFAAEELKRIKHRERSRKWAAANPERKRSYQKNWYEANKDSARAYQRELHFKRTYGITIAERDEIFAHQGYKCAACGTGDPRSKKGWVVDHCHESGKIRGVLCHGCNSSLGYAYEDPARLRALADYIEGHKNALD